MDVRSSWKNDSPLKVKVERKRQQSRERNKGEGDETGRSKTNTNRDAKKSRICVVSIRQVLLRPPKDSRASNDTTRHDDLRFLRHRIHHKNYHFLGFCLFTGGRRRPAKKNKNKGERRDFCGREGSGFGIFPAPSVLRRPAAPAFVRLCVVVL